MMDRDVSVQDIKGKGREPDLPHPLLTHPRLIYVYEMAKKLTEHIFLRDEI